MPLVPMHSSACSNVALLMPDDVVPGAELRDHLSGCRLQDWQQQENWVQGCSHVQTAICVTAFRVCERHMTQHRASGSLRAGSCALAKPPIRAAMRHFRATPPHTLLCRQPACHQLSSCTMPAAQDKHGECWSHSHHAPPMAQSPANQAACAGRCTLSSSSRPPATMKVAGAPARVKFAATIILAVVYASLQPCTCPAPGAGERSPSSLACIYNMPERHAVIPSPPPLCALVLGWGSRKEVAVSAGGCCPPLAYPLHPSAGAAATVDAWPALSKSSSAMLLLFAGCLPGAACML